MNSYQKEQLEAISMVQSHLATLAAFYGRWTFLIIDVYAYQPGAFKN